MELLDQYKAIQRLLRSVDLRESLLVVRCYLDWVQRGRALPSEIKIPTIYQQKSPMELGIYAFQLETLCKEIVANAPLNPDAPVTLSYWDQFASVINAIKALEEDIHSQLVSKDRIWTELVRIAHRQFPWQENLPSSSLLMRHYMIYTSPRLQKQFEEQFEYSPDEHFLMGTLLFGHFSDHFALGTPIRYEVENVRHESLMRLLDAISIGPDKFKSLLQAENKIDEQYAYRYSSLRKYPLVKLGHYGRVEYICPMPILLLWRLTSGLYYDLCGSGEFGDNFGHAFQQYIDGLAHEAASSSRLTVISEKSYKAGRDRKDTADLIVHDTAAIFVEVKTKRLTQSAKEEIDSDDALNAQLEYQADNVVQLYKSIQDYENNLYPGFPYDEGMEIFPVIVTLESWHLFGHVQLGFVEERVRAKLQRVGIDVSICDQYPYTFCAASEFERCMSVVGDVGVGTALGGKTRSPEHAKWELGVYLAEKFPTEWAQSREMFRGKFEALFDRWIQSDRQ